MCTIDLLFRFVVLKSLLFKAQECVTEVVEKTLMVEVAAVPVGCVMGTV